MTVRQSDHRAGNASTLVCLLMCLQLVACQEQAGHGNLGALFSPDSGSSPTVFVEDVDVGEPVTGSATLSWTAPVTRADGTPISLADIAGYRVYYGLSEGNYPNRIDIQDGTAEQVTLNSLPSGAYYFVMTTYDVAGRESVFSPAVEKTI